MNEVNAFWLAVGLFSGASFASSMFYLRDWKREVIIRKREVAAGGPRTETTRTNPLKVIVHSVNETTPEMRQRRKEIDEEIANFAVTGKPIKPSWRIRKRELEAAARTKRKKLESFQEYV